jgi:hypothetical protein
MFARARNKHESRRTLRQLLTEEDFSNGKMTNVLQAHVDRDRLILSNVGDPPPEPPSGELERIVDLTAGSFRVCQAVRRRNPAPCADLGDYRTDCESLAAIAMLQKGACTEDVIRILSGLFERKPAATRKFCLALSNRQPEMCLAIPDASKKDIAFCRAMAGGGETACRNPVLSAVASQECLFELDIHEVLSGRIPASAILDEYKKHELVWMALMAASSDASCVELALRIYDEAVVSFQLFTYIFG